MKARISTLLAPLLVAAACGETISPDHGAPPEGESDAGADAAAAADASPDAAPAVAPPPPLPRCPLVRCTGDIPDDLCTDDDCAEPIETDFIQGSVVSTVDERCVADKGFVAEIEDRASARPLVGVAFHLHAVSAGDTPMPIARISIDGDDAGERFEVVVTRDRVALCESGRDVPTVCTPSVALAEDVAIQLHGVASSEDPPRASFALSLGCGEPLVLAVTRPFAPGNLRGSVGCLASTPGECRVTFDDFVIFNGPE